MTPRKKVALLQEFSPECFAPYGALDFDGTRLTWCDRYGEEPENLADFVDESLELIGITP